MIDTKAAFFQAEADHSLLPGPPLRFPGRPEELTAIRWDLLALNHAGCRALLANRTVCTCKTLLLPGDSATSITQLIQAEQVVSTGLSHQCTITVSSLMNDQALVCLQRTLVRPDGSALEPQELLMPIPPLPVEEQLLILALRLLT